MNNSVHIKDKKEPVTFITFVFGEKVNRTFLYIISFLLIIQFLVFKLCYPYPDFFSDSYSYIYAAYAHLNANIWPIGYSIFLSVFHSLTHAHYPLNFFQYIFLEIAALYFYFTIVYVFPTSKRTRTFLCIFLFFNPINLYLANYITSDAIFIGLSLIWLTQLIWTIFIPNPYQVIINAVIFFIAFTFRYNAMYYPIITAIVYLISKHNIWIKVVGLLAGPVLIIPFIIFSSKAAKTLTGTAQFPPILGGWQWANNALYMREYVNPDIALFPSKETRELDGLARDFFETVPWEQRNLPDYVANYFIRVGKAPLKQYLYRKYRIHDEYSNVIAWGKVAPVFGDYGRFLIKRYPLAYARYYLLVNTKNYFLPPLEKLEIYNLGADSIWKRGQSWFSMATPKVKSINKYLQGLILLPYPTLFMLLNVFYSIALVRLIIKKKLSDKITLPAIVIGIITLFLILNFFFSIFANIIVIRYQIFPMILLLSFGLLTLDILQISKKDRLPKERKIFSADTYINDPQIQTVIHAK